VGSGPDSSHNPKYDDQRKAYDPQPHQGVQDNLKKGRRMAAARDVRDSGDGSSYDKRSCEKSDHFVGRNVDKCRTRPQASEFRKETEVPSLLTGSHQQTILK
jgi:hypothetical protein